LVGSAAFGAAVGEAGAPPQAARAAAAPAPSASDRINERRLVDMLVPPSTNSVPAARPDAPFHRPAAAATWGRRSTGRRTLQL
jgi:hypothetical protein